MNVVRFSLAFGSVFLALFLLWYLSGLLIPFVVAVLIWYLINALANAYGRIAIREWRPPAFLSLLAAIVSVLAVLFFLFQLVSANVTAVTKAAPLYGQNLEELVERWTGAVGLKMAPNVTEILNQIDIGALIRGVAGTLTGIAGKTGLILIYLLFLFLEQKSFRPKLAALFPDDERKATVQRAIARIVTSIQSYIFIKTLMSLLTGGLSFVILGLVGLDFAVFWGFAAFLLNYIPVIGSVVAVILPALLAVLQFDVPTPPIMILVSLGIVQFVVGNVLEPRLHGERLNLSPLVVLLSLALWGTIWGVVGMFLSVPITVTILIICSEFRRTRPLAIILSQSGKID